MRAARQQKIERDSLVFVGIILLVGILVIAGTAAAITFVFG